HPGASALAGLPLSECSDDSRRGRVLIPLVDGGFSYCGEDLRRLSAHEIRSSKFEVRGSRFEVPKTLNPRVSLVPQVSPACPAGMFSSSLTCANDRSFHKQKSFPEPARAGVY